MLHRALKSPATLYQGRRRNSHTFRPNGSILEIWRARFELNCPSNSTEEPCERIELEAASTHTADMNGVECDEPLRCAGGPRKDLL